MSDSNVLELQVEEDEDMETVALKAAQEQVHFYGNQTSALLSRHDEAMECLDCEDLLELGIGAFKWIGRAEQSWRSKIYEGEATYDGKTDYAITALYEAWLKSCEYAEQNITIQIQRGYYPDNLDKFRSCCQEVRDIVEQRALAAVARQSQSNCPDEDSW